MLKPVQDKSLEPSCGRLLLVEDDTVFCDRLARALRS